MSGACVDTKSRDIEATFTISGDRGRPCVTKTLAVASEQGYTNFVYIFTNTIIDDSTKPKAH